MEDPVREGEMALLPPSPSHPLPPSPLREAGRPPPLFTPVPRLPQMHDEIILEVREASLLPIARMAKRVMEGVMDGQVGAGRGRSRGGEGLCICAMEGVRSGGWRLLAGRDCDLTPSH